MGSESSRQLHPFTEGMLRGMRQRLAIAYRREYRVTRREAIKLLMDDLTEELIVLQSSESETESESADAS